MNKNKDYIPQYQHNVDYQQAPIQHSPLTLWLYRVLFIFGILFAMSLYKILYFIGKDSVRNIAMGKIFVFLFCLGNLGLVILGAVIRIISKIVAGSQQFKTSEKLIDYDVPIIWIISRVMGWVYVDKHTQIAIIGKKKYKRSGIFFTSPFSIERQVVISTRKVPYKEEITTYTQSSQILKVKIAGYYQIDIDKVDRLINEIEDVVEYFTSMLRNILIGFIQSVPASTIYKNEKKARELLKNLLEKEMLYFHVSVDALNLMGKMVEDEDELARIIKIIMLKLMHSYPAIMEATAEKTFEVLIKQHLMNYMRQGKSIDESQVPKIWEDFQSTYGKRLAKFTSPDTFIQDVTPKTLPSTSDFETQLLLALSKSPFRQISKKRNSYTLEYKGYIIVIEPKDETVLVTLFKPDGVKRGPELSSKTVEELLDFLQKKIDLDLEH